MSQSGRAAFYAAFQRWTYLQNLPCPRIRNAKLYSPQRIRHSSTTANDDTRNRTAEPVLRKVNTGPPPENATKKSAVRKFTAKPYVKEPSRTVDKQEQNSTSETLRLVMREIPHSVVVVTASREYASAPWQKSERPHMDFCGATISSMTSVTLGPPAIISFNLKTPSTTLDSILANKEFRIHLLTANRDGAEVANSFIKHKHEEAFDHLRAHGRSVGTGAGYQEMPPPTLHGPGIRGYLLCTVLDDKCIEVGDHIVVIARVDGVRPRDYDALPGGMGCLMYANQQYKRHGDSLVLHERSSPLRPTASEGNLAAIRFISENEPELVRRLTMLLREGGEISSEESRLSEKTSESSVKDGALMNDALDSVLRYVDVGRSELIRKVDFKLKAIATRGEEGGDDVGNRSLEDEVVGRLVELIERSPEEWAKRAIANQEPKGKQEKGHQPWWHI